MKAKKRSKTPTQGVPTVCQYSKCGKPIEQRGKNKDVPRKYCNARCRVAAWAERNPRTYENQ
jgi:hypothetical protein